MGVISVTSRNDKGNKYNYFLAIRYLYVSYRNKFNYEGQIEFV
jgi:hypothetical protein